MKKDVITYDDFMKLDIRVGKIIEAQVPEGSKKLIELTVDLGEDYGTVTIFTGMLEYYQPENFIGKKFQFIANLAPRKMMGKESQGMLLSADENGKPLLIQIDSYINNGLTVR